MAKNQLFHVQNFALACGITWGLGIFLLGFLAAFAQVGAPIVDFIGSGYLGYSATPEGSLIGGVWGFIDAFIGGYIFAWLYNWLCSRK
ncbi:hypothetical protein COU77_02750 [Candidatus Peregrinibacteria bacterium CG10_big_fil_rev_8_21_14_0_10_49_16]|nr:MAG: hypothetical protein COW95_02260 [Candidatus Peregrinibacteria bacterium CG22_combo_CG10-13_8_21_14_all_49_11]PIR52035.1 MAG: hypothetical protein COU77_02750 [Candidatus Peregrinibacteria bacterium CG10_big_fil_rev_8_21_14_0_10_49_16]